MCLAEAQVFILELAFRKSLDPELMAELSRGAHDLYTECCKTSSNLRLSILLKEETKIFLNNRRHFYLAFTHFK